MGKNFQGLYVLIAFISTLLVGTIGYYLIEGWPLLDALYMTAITITTVGFHEEHPLSPGGKVFTIFLIFTGFGICVITLSNVTLLILKGELNNWVRRYFLNAKIELFKDHFILCGFGRMGREVAKQLELKNIPFVIVENSQERAPSLADSIHPVIIGNAADESVLKKAGIDHAKCLISVVSSDADNAFTVMTARSLNEKLHIVSRCFMPSSFSKLKVAGANQVVSPYMLSGNRITQAALHPTMVEFVEFIEDTEDAAIEMADLVVDEKSCLVNEPLNGSVLNEVDVIIVGIKKNHGKFVFHPKGETVIEAEDHLVVVGPRDNVDFLANKSGC